MLRRGVEVDERAVVSLPQGALAGRVLDDCVVWRGIPYARPPVGALRWRAPQPAPPWSGVRAAYELGPRAPQPPDPGSDPAGATAQPAPLDDEDCLTLNVCAPAAPAAPSAPSAPSGPSGPSGPSAPSAPSGPPPAGGWPVLVWVHGGGFRTGSGAMYGDGQAFARDGAVVVTFNHRLGALGFLDLGALFGASEADAGACGLLDQIAALRWVRDHVGAFGGDPARVTLYGQSAGGMAVGCLMASPPARGLFSRALVSSGGADNVAEPGAAAALARRLVDELGVDDPAALRAVPARDVIAAQERLLAEPHAAWLWRPALHAQALPQAPIERIAAGSAAGVDLLVGHNGDEAALFVAEWGREAVVRVARALLRPTFGRETDRLLDVYRARRGGAAAAVPEIAALGDVRYGIPTRRLADAQSAHGRVWRYRVDVAAPGMPAALDGAHTTETPMAWHAAGGADPAHEPRARVADQIHAAWSAFVRDGAPRAPGLPPWPRYDPATRAVMVLADDSHVAHDPRRAERLAWGDRVPQPSPCPREQGGFGSP